MAVAEPIAVHQLLSQVAQIQRVYPPAVPAAFQQSMN
jgi:hypothetical protein